MVNLRTAILGASAGLAGLALRAAGAAVEPLWFDETTVGLMGRHVLGGEFPVFFWGQAFMGAAEAYLHALVFATAGASVAALRLWPVLLSLLHAGLAGLLAARLVGQGRVAAVLALLPAPFLLKWSHDARLHYDLVLVLTPLLLLLALEAAGPARASAARTRTLLVLAAVAGLACWVNLLLGVVAGTVALGLGLALASRRPDLHPLVLLAPVALLAGSLPVWLVAAGHGRPPVATVPLAPTGLLLRHAGDLLARGLPIVAGVPAPILDGPGGTLAAVGAVILFGLAVTATLGPGRADRIGRLLVGLVLAGNIGAVLLTVHGGNLATEDPRYLLAVLALWPVLLAGLVARIGGRREAAAAAATVALVGLQLAAVWMEHPALRSRDAWAARRGEIRARARAVEDLVATAPGFLYTHDPDLVTFASGERVVVSHLYLDSSPRLARRVDGAPRVGYLGTGPPGLADSLAAAGIRFTRHPTPLGPLWTDFSLDPVTYREVTPEGWAATASEPDSLPAHAVDRDAATAWRSRGGRHDRLWLQIDLGRAHPIGMVAWLPGSYREVPSGFRLETSGDGIAWTSAQEVPVYAGPLYWSHAHPMGRVRWGRVEVRFPARAARHLRLTHRGDDPRHPWSIRELHVYAAEAGAAPLPGDLAPVLDALRQAGVTRAYADHGLGAALAEAAGGALSVAPANVRVDAIGTVPPIDQLPIFRPGPDTALVVPAAAAAAPALAAALASAGWSAREHVAGGYRILTGWHRTPLGGAPLRPAGLRVTAAPGPNDPLGAIDGQIGTRWSTGAPQAPGQWLEARWDTLTEVAGVELDLGPFRTDYPRSLALEVTADGRTWLPLAAPRLVLGPLAWSGTHLLRAGAERVVLRFAPRPLTGLRLTQTGRDPRFDWSVAELRLLRP
jgi:hypothetical protein